ncbi:hypothetical protein DDZ18_09960 [Marinicauda salina]|uniref:DUF2336 domain-containing protein n=1 Tax=Marinicauda salina TaxID=2135793 RepID=A0A2U2BSP7_9PROT|nr:DUF2336 domain-containing protein [Marinicauda salina]PWE17020.1 hypothetical protein DDZ18_09960 [Marinicauda salina]
MSGLSKLDALTALAKEKSSDRRRELLREVTDLFFDTEAEAGSSVQSQFGEILSVLASQAAQDARVELSRRFADAEAAPRDLILQLARDAIEVAAPVLQGSSALSEEDLVAIVEEASQQHMRAISQREDVSEKVSEAIVEHGDDETVATLVSNDNASLSRRVYEEVTRRAQESETLQAPLVGRQDTPPDLLNDLLVVVKSTLRETILQRFDGLEPKALEDALAASDARLRARLAEDKDIAEAEKFVATKSMRKELNGSLLASLLRERKHVHFCVAFAELAGVDFSAAKRALDHESLDPLALICKAANFERPLFVTLAMLREGDRRDAFAAAEDYGRHYDAIEPAVAERAMRFWRMRRDMAAA